MTDEPTDARRSIGAGAPATPPGEVVLGLLVAAMARLPRYRDLPIADLIALAIEPVALGRVKVVPPPPGAPAHMPAFAIWASVSPEVNERLRAATKREPIPVRLAAGEWASGEILWLLDLIAPTRNHASIALLDVGRSAGERPLHTHPMIRTLVDPDLFDKLRPPAAVSAPN